VTEIFPSLKYDRNGAPAPRVEIFNSGVRKNHCTRSNKHEERNATELARQLWSGEEGQDIGEYAFMLAVIRVIVVGTTRLIGSNANNVFSNVASSIQ